MQFLLSLKLVVVLTLVCFLFGKTQTFKVDPSGFDDPTFLDLSESLQSRFIRDQLNPPALVFVAGQSDGKSLFISLRAGYPIAFSANGIGTRCPVRYVYRNSDDIGVMSEATKQDHTETAKDNILETAEAANIKIKMADTL